MLIGTLSASVPPHPRSADDVIVDRMIGSHTPHDDSSSESSIEGQSELVPNPTGIGIDRLSDFHIQSGIVDRSWILFDSGASANCCPPWFASDYPLHPVGSDCPALRSISGKTLSILGKRIVELDCNGHSLCVQFYVCEHIPFPLVSVSRFLLQDFWTIMAKDFMALMTPSNQTVPIVRQGTLVYLTPTVIPYSAYSGPRTESEISSLMDDLDLETIDLELRGITDSTHCEYDHLSKISSLVAMAQARARSKPAFARTVAAKRKATKNMDYWEIDDPNCLLIRHHVKTRRAMFGLTRLRSSLPVAEDRLTGARVTKVRYKDGTEQVYRDADWRSLEDPDAALSGDWTGTTEFALYPASGQLETGAKRTRERTRPQEALSSSPRPTRPIESVPSRGTEKESKKVRIVSKQPEKPQSATRSAPSTLEQVSRGEPQLGDSEIAILRRLRSIGEFNAKMREDLVRLYHTLDSTTSKERTTDYWLQLPNYWVRTVHQKRTDTVHPDDEPSPIAEQSLGDLLTAERYTYIVESQFPELNGSEIEDLWCTMLDPDGVETEPKEDPRPELYHVWRGFVVFASVPIEVGRPIQDTDDKHARVAKGLKVPGEPSASERAQHELTHLPFRDWCPHCVKSKGRHGPAKKQSDRQPVIQVDYCFQATHPDLPLRKILSACDVQTGLGMAVIVPSKGENNYAVAELKKFIYECGRTFGILQYDQESPLKNVCQRVCAELGGLSLRAAPKSHPQSSGSVGQMQRTLYGQVRTLIAQVEQNLNIQITSDHVLYPWALKHAQWLLNRYLVHSDGCTSYYRRWNRNYEGGLCQFAEVVHAKVIGGHAVRKADIPWKSALWLGRDTEADEIIVATDEGVTKVRTVRRTPPSQHWQPDIVNGLKALPWKPKTDGEHTTEFVLPKSLTVIGKVRDPPGLTPPVEPKEVVRTENLKTEPLQLEDMPERRADTSIAEQPTSSSAGIVRPAEAAEDERAAKSLRIDPEAPVAEPSPKSRKIAAVMQLIGATVGVNKAVTKDGVEVPVHVNYDEDEYRTELKLTEPIIWDITREYPELAQKKGMDHEMGSMKDFNVYTEVPIEKCTEEQTSNAIGVRWVKRWKTDTELRMRLVVQGCYQDATKLDTDSLFASTPSLVTMRLLLVMALARNWSISLADISTAFLHAAIGAGEEIFVVPPAEYYPTRNCLWKLNRAMYGLKQSPRLWQEHFAKTMQKLGFRRCKSDSNLYCHSSKQLYVLAYVDDLMIVGDPEQSKAFIDSLNKELLVKITGRLEAGSEHSFLGRKLRHNGDSIDILMSQQYIEEILKLYSMNSSSNIVNTTGSSALKRAQDSDTPLDKEEHSKFRTAVGKLLWLAFVRPDCSYAVKELSRDVKGPTLESLAKLKHLLRYLNGTRHTVLRLRPTHMLTDWKSSLELVCFVDSDWAGCSKTRKSTSGSTVQLLGSPIVHTSRTQATVALSSGEAELYAIGQGINEALYVKSIILEAEFARKVRITVHTDSTAGKSIASRFGTGKRTKHIELRYLYMQNLIDAGMLRVCKIGTKDNCADLLTKYVSTETLQSLLNRLGLIRNDFRL